jgi:hypothetical protein
MQHDEAYIVTTISYSFIGELNYSISIHLKLSLDTLTGLKDQSASLINERTFKPIKASKMGMEAPRYLLVHSSPSYVNCILCSL